MGVWSAANDCGLSVAETPADGCCDCARTWCSCSILWLAHFNFSDVWIRSSSIAETIPIALSGSGCPNPSTSSRVRSSLCRASISIVFRLVSLLAHLFFYLNTQRNYNEHILERRKSGILMHNTHDTHCALSAIQNSNGSRRLFTSR